MLTDYSTSVRGHELETRIVSKAYRLSTEGPDYQRLGRDLIAMEREARQLGSRQTVNLRVLELETAKQILEQPPGNVISWATTNNDGRYGFYSLVPGEYAVVENLEMGWNLTTPSDGKYAVNLTSNTTMLNFGNKMMPAPTRNMTSPATQLF